MIDINTIEQKLKNYGYKLTSQRRAIIEIFFENQSHLVSAEEIYIKCLQKGFKTNFSTVYRNLELLQSTDIINKIVIDGNAATYELICSNNHHHHIICKKCGKIENIEFCPIDEINKKLKDKDFVLTDHKFELYGYCKDCKKK